MLSRALFVIKTIDLGTESGLFLCLLFEVDVGVFILFDFLLHFVYIVFYLFVVERIFFD